jgi:ATP-dependent DNA helicase DinG
LESWVLGGFGLQELNFSFIAIDFETTGFLPDGEIIEIGMVKVQNKSVTETYNQLIKPLGPIPKEITFLTGITNEMVAAKPYWPEVVNEVLEFIGDNILVAHNVEFDKNILEKSLGYCLPNLWVDTLDLAKISLPALPNYKLSYLVNVLKVQRLTNHRAIDDAKMTADIFIKLIKEFQIKPPFELTRIINLLSTNERNGLINLLEFINKTNITNYWSTPKEKIVSEKPSKRLNSILNFSFNDAQSFFAPDGVLSTSFTNYEFRPQQLKMLKIITEAFVENTHAFIEAGTGTGKSLAYLIPALLWANEYKCKIIISTNTIALQEQLFYTDILFLENTLNCKLPVSIVKGRSNYLCLKRFHKLCENNQSLNWREKIFLVQIDNWLQNTNNGDKEEINLNKYENDLWLQISSQAETCLGNKCSYQHQCFYLRNRREADKNNLIITNHSLLLQDIKRESKLLPQYEYVIIDEAHNLEDEAFKQLAEEVNFRYLKKGINYLIRGKQSSLVYQAHNKTKLHDLEINLDKLEALISPINEEGSNLELKLNECLKFIVQGNECQISELRITDKERNNKWWIKLKGYVQDICNNLSALIYKSTALVNQIEIFDELEEIVKELRFQIGLLTESYLTMEKFIADNEKDHVYWLQISADNVVFVITPFNIAEILQKKLFNTKKSVILTSATLSVNNTFEHILAMYGLEKHKIQTLIADTPFDYQQQSMICIPTDLPEPSFIAENEYQKGIIDCLIKLLPVINGGTLILFTSYKMLNDVYIALKNAETVSHKEFLAHGKDGSRKVLIEALKNNPEKTILLGTNSFWEGIDIQGIGLTAVIIVKLPFAPPNRPVIAARLESLEKNKENSFYKYSLPTAILKFRQGFGRLIRSKKDWGALIILDKRIITKNYGGKFIKSIPLQPVIKAPTEIILKELSQWMRNKYEGEMNLLKSSNK